MKYLLIALMLTACTQQKEYDPKYWEDKYWEEMRISMALRYDTTKAWEVINERRADSSFIRIGGCQLPISKEYKEIRMKGDTIFLIR